MSEGAGAGIYMPLSVREVFLISCIALTWIILSSCSDTQTNAYVPQAIIHLEKIIDKESRELLKKEHNNLEVRDSRMRDNQY